MIIDETTTDADLLAAWTAAGDPEALAIIAYRYAPMVLGVCRRHCRTVTDADDAFQVTFMILARSAAAIRSPSALPGWLHGTAYRVATRTRRRPTTSDDVRIEDIPDPREPLDRISRCHDLQLLDEELAQMPEPLRAALVMHYLEGLRISQIAERLESTLGAIRGRLQRGRRELRQRLILRGVSLGGALAALEVLPNHTAAASELADAFVISATADAAAMPSAGPHEIADLPWLLSSSTSSSASLLMKTCLVLFASLVATLLLPWGQREAQPPAGTTAQRSNDAGGVLKLAGAPASPPGTAFQAPAPAPAAASDGPKASAAAGPAPQPKPPVGDPFALDLPSSQPSAPPSSQPRSQLTSEPFGGPPSSGPSTGTPGSDPFGRDLPSSPPSGNPGGSPSDNPFGQNARSQPLGGTSPIAPPKAPVEASGVRAPEDSSDFTRQLEARLREQTEIQIGAVPMSKFVTELSQAIEAPVFIQLHTELTGVDEATSISLDSSGLPLGVELKKALRPHGLRAIVRDEALLITADTLELTRRGIGTSRYVNVDDAYMKDLEEKLAQPYSQSFNQIPLEDAVRIISTEAEVQIAIDRRALENIGLTRDVPVTVDVSDVTLYAFLQRTLRDLDLSLRPADGILMITTLESAEDPSNLLSRVYWLDGTGLSAEEAAKMIENTIDPGTWEALGGSSTILGLTANEHGRPTLIVSAPYAVHYAVEKLLKTIREGVVDPAAGFPEPDSSWRSGSNAPIGGIGPGNGAGGMKKVGRDGGK